jgi:hypothetical protein
MPDLISPTFEHEALEADIKILAQEVARQRESPENVSLGEKELLKQAIKSMPPPPPPTQNQPIPQPPRKSPIPDYAQNAPAEVKLEIEYLLDLAFHHGIARAVAEAKKSPAFVLDAFHDALAGKLYPEFKKRGIVK